MGAKASLRSKLIILCLSISCVSFIVGFIAIMSMKSISANYEHVAKVNLPNIATAQDMFLAFRSVRLQLNFSGLEGVSQEKLNDALTRAQTSINDYEKAEKDYLAIEYAPGVSFGPGEEEAFNETHKEWVPFKEAALEIIQLAKSSNPDDRKRMMDLLTHKLVPLGDSYRTAAQKLFQYQKDEANSWVQKAEASAQLGSAIIAGAILFGFILASILGLYFSSRLSTHLKQITVNLRKETERIAGLSGSMANSASGLSSQSVQQAAALQQTASAIAQVSSMVTQTSENATKSQEISEHSYQAATEGKQAVDQMMNSISEISDSNKDIMTQIEESNKQISEIVGVISQISEKTKVINDIVFQTKLLSFNASVEAARAGEQGKGFSVVAEEVGSLAQMSGVAAKEISDMLAESMHKVEAIVNETQTKVEALVRVGREKVETGSSTAQICSEALEQIVTYGSQVRSMMGQIASASKEQSTGVQEINRAISEMDDVTQKNSASANESSQMAEGMKAQASELEHMVGSLVAIVEGKAA